MLFPVTFASFLGFPSTPILLCVSAPLFLWHVLSGTAHSLCISNMQVLPLSCLHDVFTRFVIKCSLPSSLLNQENNLATPKSGATTDSLSLLCLVAARLFLPASLRRSCGGRSAGGFFSCLSSFPFSFPRRDISSHALTIPRVGFLLPAWLHKLPAAFCPSRHDA